MSTAALIPHPLIDGFAPHWADSWGQDEFGVYAELPMTAADGSRVVQRLRWIPPGTFLMGSPDDEAGRYEEEGPQHRVQIPAGFWLFDTPCTQATWTAVIGDKPSYFRDPERPVEQVSWQDCQQFLDKLNEQLRIDLRLPTEAQWEYACRAGTTTATYDGPLEILGQRDAPGLDEIAWYGGNSGVEFDLDGGFDSKDWPEKQYDHSQAGTRKVGLKAPNDWGLYDMLGNVLEWCDDWHRPYPVPSGDHRIEEEASRRVLRGGSWYDVARYARSACRFAFGPEYRDDYIGFRCALVQATSNEFEAERASSVEQVDGGDARQR